MMKKALFSESCQPLSVHRERRRTTPSPGISVQLTSDGGAVLSTVFHVKQRPNSRLHQSQRSSILCKGSVALRATYNTLKYSK